MIVHSTALFRHDASGYESERAGTSRGIFFSNFLQTLVKAHSHAFRGWELRIHHDERARGLAYFDELERMHADGLLRLVPMGHAQTLCGSMLWRLEAAYDPEVEWVVCRDVDSLPMERDRVMVEEAMASGAEVHAILDSESHSGPLMGGMTAFKASLIREVWPTPEKLHKAMAKWPPEEWNWHGCDQRFLNSTLWPFVAPRTFVHQRRLDIGYPEAMKTKAVAPAVTDLDKVIRHIGAAYNRERVMEILDK